MPPQPLKSAPKPKGLFHNIAPQECTILSMPREMIFVNGEPFLTYECKNGNKLRWFQTQDFEALVAETISREVMRLENDANWKMVPQGKILHYEMG